MLEWKLTYLGHVNAGAHGGFFFFFSTFGGCIRVPCVLALWNGSQLMSIPISESNSSQPNISLVFFIN